MQSEVELTLSEKKRSSRRIGMTGIVERAMAKLLPRLRSPACRPHAPPELTKKSFDGHMTLIVVRIRVADGGRRTVDAPNSTSASIPF